MSYVKPTAMIFDLDGTLIDSLPGIEFSVKAAFVSCRIPFPAIDLRKMIGPPIQNILSQVAETTDPSILADLERAFRASYDENGWQKTLCYPGTESALHALQEAGIRLFVVTNKPQQVSLRIAEMIRIKQFFESIVTRDSRSPQYADKGEMIESLLHSNALDARNCLLVGDTAEDACAAALCGMPFAHIRHGYGTISENVQSPVCLKLNSLSELPQWIGLEFAHDR